MRIYIHHRTKNLCPPQTFADTCYGPFKSVKGAKIAMDYLKRVDANTGCWYDTVALMRRKGEPEFRTLSWEDVCNSERRFMEDKKDWHLI
jgi:ABC-type sulfate transport system substrate-binding protein